MKKNNPSEVDTFLYIGIIYILPIYRRRRLRSKKDMRYNLNIWLFADKPYGCFKSYQGLRFFLKSLHIKARVKKTIIRFSTKEDCYKFMDGLMGHKKFNVFDLRFDVDVRTMNNQKCDLDGNILPTFKRRVIA